MKPVLDKLHFWPVMQLSERYESHPGRRPGKTASPLAKKIGDPFAGATLPRFIKGDLSLSPAFPQTAPQISVENNPRQERSLQQKKGFVGRVLDAYYKPRSFEKNGTIYKALGVHLFKRALMGTVGRFFSWAKESTGEGNGYCLGGRTLKDLSTSETWTRAFEAMHVAAILFTNLSIGNFWSPVNIGCLCLNFYCVILQRFNRGRLYKAMEKAAQRPSGRIPHFKTRKVRL